MIPRHEAARYMQRVHDWRMEIFPGYVCLSVDECAENANGIGSDDTPEWLRDTLGALLPHVREAAFLHDLEGCFANDGTRTGFIEWNARFRRNIRKAIQRNIPFWMIRTRRALYKTADMSHAAVSSDIGWTAWRKAYERAQAESEPGPEVVG